MGAALNPSARGAVRAMANCTVTTSGGRERCSVLSFPTTGLVVWGPVVRWGQEPDRTVGPGRGCARRERTRERSVGGVPRRLRRAGPRGTAPDPFWITPGYDAGGNLTADDP